MLVEPLHRAAHLCYTHCRGVHENLVAAMEASKQLQHDPFTRARICCSAQLAVQSDLPLSTAISLASKSSSELCAYTRAKLSCLHVENDLGSPTALSTTATEHSYIGLALGGSYLV